MHKPLVTLEDACKQFIYHNPRITNARTVEHYVRAVREFSEVLGRPATIEDLSDDNVLALLHNVLSRGLSPVTANHRRKCLLALWSWLARRRIIDSFPCVPKVKEPKRLPRAWTMAELAKLIQSCREATGIIGGAAAADWWCAFHAVMWDTAARTTEVMTLEWSWLNLETGILTVPAATRKGKTSDAVYQLQPDTVAMLRKIITPHPLIFFGIGHPSNLFKRYRTLLLRAGLPADRYSMPQKMRRSHASHLKAAGGDATSSLMHTTDQVTRESYYDRTITDVTPSSLLFRILDAPGLESVATADVDKRKQLLDEHFKAERFQPGRTKSGVADAAPTAKEVRDAAADKRQPGEKNHWNGTCADEIAMWPGRLLNPQHVLELLSICPHTLSRLVEANKIPFVKFGRLTRFPAEELGKWVCEKWQQTKAEIESLPQQEPPIADPSIVCDGPKIDALSVFIGECCQLREGAEILSSELYTAYVAHCLARDVKPLAQPHIGRLMTSRGFQRKFSAATVPTGSRQAYLGIELRSGKAVTS